MGGGTWSSVSYSTRSATKYAGGKTTFDYSDTTRTRARSAWTAHETLDPKGVKVRESRDSDEHPTTTPIVVMLDVTGSMHAVITALHAKLPELYGLLLRKGYVEHPQIMFGGIGDATCDRVPLQVGQFESDNRADVNLEDLFLEGGGGGQRTESYELAAYFLANHTATDAWDKRGQKGYVFIVGDEMNYPRVSRRQVEEHVGDTLQDDVTTEEVYRSLQERYEVFYILPAGASYGGDATILAHWRKLLGQNVLELDDANAVCETIALQVGLAEGTIDLDEGLDDLRDAGADPKAIAAAGKAVVAAGPGAAPATASDDLPPIDGGSGGVDRL